MPTVAWVKEVVVGGALQTDIFLNRTAAHVYAASTVESDTDIILSN
jgi:hypothetical protein